MNPMTLTEFLLDRIAEDESDPWRGAELMGADRVVGLAEREALAKEEGEWEARVQRECEAKRRIVELHEGFTPYPGLGMKCETCADNPEADYDGTPMIEWPCPTIRALALPYADHPDYREEWRP